MKTKSKTSIGTSLNIEHKGIEKMSELLKSSYYCYDCNRCINICPLSPFGLFYPRQLVRDFSTYSVEEAINNSNIWSCLTCGLCSEYCPMSKDNIGVNFLDIILKLRTIATENDPFQEEKLQCTTHGRLYSNLPHLMANDQIELVNKIGFLDNTDLKIAKKGEIAYFIGCLPFMNGISPCTQACPANIDVQSYITLIKEGRFQESLNLIREKNPLPGVCGRICTHPCELNCNRNTIDKPIAIRALKRFVADWEIKNQPLSQLKPFKQTKEQVAIIGSGPAGLTAAYFLAKKGYKPTIFEASPFKGGMLRVGIPEYRLPDDILDYEIEFIEKSGVEIKTDTPIGPDLTFKKLTNMGYKAIFISIGLQSSRSMRLEGEELNNVIGGIEFLKDLRPTDQVSKKSPVIIKDKIIGVTGGGNVAMDSARTAVRLGAKKVIVIYRRSEKEMPATEEEIEMANEENIDFQFLTNPVRIIGDKKGNVSKVECIRMKLGEPDSSGRRRPIQIEGSEFKMKIDVLILAIGQEADYSLLKAAQNELIISKRDKIQIDDSTLETNIPGVFAGGDVTEGQGIAIRAIANGYEAAISIDRYLRGIDIGENRFKREEFKTSPIPKKEVNFEERNDLPIIPIEERCSSFNEVELEFTEEIAIQEANRCLNCNSCSNCDIPYEKDDDSFNNSQKSKHYYGTCQFPLYHNNIDYLKIPKTTIGILNLNNITPVVLADEKCCGHDCYWTGDLDTFEKLAKYNAKLYKDAGVKTIICSCAEGYYMWKYVYKEFFKDDNEYDFEVYHISEYIQKEKLLDNLKLSDQDKIKITYHDPCRLGRLSNVYDAPRDILNNFPNVELIEMINNRQDANCCGVSAYISCSNYSKLLQGQRINEAIDTGAEYLIVTCPKCLTHFNCYLQENRDLKLKVMDLVSFLGMIYHDKEILLQ